MVGTPLLRLGEHLGTKIRRQRPLRRPHSLKQADEVLGFCLFIAFECILPWHYPSSPINRRHSTRRSRFCTNISACRSSTFSGLSPISSLRSQSGTPCISTPAVPGLSRAEAFDSTALAC